MTWGVNVKAAEVMQSFAANLCGCRSRNFQALHSYEWPHNCRVRSVLEQHMGTCQTKAMHGRNIQSAASDCGHTLRLTDLSFRCLLSAKPAAPSYSPAAGSLTLFALAHRWKEPVDPFSFFLPAWCFAPLSDFPRLPATSKSSPGCSWTYAFFRLSQ